VTDLGVAYSTEKRRWLEWAVGEFAVTEKGKTVRVKLIPMNSSEAARAIVDGDERFHVWAPASKLHLGTFLRDWAAKHGEDPGWSENPIVMGRDLVLSPMVIVMWKGRYDAFVGKAPEVSWKTLGYAMHAPTGWAAIAGKPEWGRFRLSHTHPGQCDCGLVTILLLAHDFHGKTSELTVADVMSPEFHEYLIRFGSGVAGIWSSPDEMMKDMVLKGPSVHDAVVVHESAAIDLFEDAEGRWDSLQVVYPEHNFWNDHPYYVLDTPWSTGAHREAAAALLEFLLSDPIQLGALGFGFRPGNPSVSPEGPDSPFERYEQCGLRVDLPSVCELPSPEVIQNLEQGWLRNAAPRGEDR
jgi:Ca-activated chloride channel family protein